jgi:hypothetical protein
MAIKRKHDGPRARGKHERRSDGDRGDRGDDPRKHAKIIERRWLGSPPPTAERYARALRQWHALPGAVVWPATDVTVAAETPVPKGVSPTPVGPAEEESEQ